MARPATPTVSASADLSEDVTISKTTFESPPAEKLPLPPEETSGEEEDHPTLIPFDVPPELKNPGEVQRYLPAVYPRSLKQSGVGGTVVLWIYLEERGRVQETRVRDASPYPALNGTARKVARKMVFTPAMNRDKRTAVWVQQRIHFRVK